jgi:type IV secretory pathway VirB10-like protein
LEKFLFFVYTIFSDVSCDVKNATQEKNGCPKGANCIENITDNGQTLYVGACICPQNLTVNANYSASDNASLYCIEKSAEVHPTDATAPPTPTTKVATAPTPPSTVKPEVKTTAKIEPTQAATTTSSSTTTTTKAPAPATTESTKKGESDKNDVKVAPAPSSSHVFGGIFLPIFIVLAFIGGVFAIRKYDLIERAHGYIRNRNQQTRYNGLMENDFDDDPLLI